MNGLTLRIMHVVLMGIGATLTFDLWGLFLKQIFRISPSHICLVGRWLRYMPDGVFAHADISASPQKRAECQVGWMAHYLIGVTFAGVFVAIMETQWLEHPMPVPAVVFGVVTVLAPFLIMQPSFGGPIILNTFLGYLRGQLSPVESEVPNIFHFHRRSSSAPPAP